eukprot:243953-Rhodomonas_salina.2
MRTVCKVCGGSQICEHDRRRRECKECGGSAICEHSRTRAQCTECREKSVLACERNGITLVAKKSGAP